MTRSGLLVVAMALASGVACFPEVASVVGKRCDDAHPCGEGFECAPDGRCIVEGTWTPDGGTADPLPNLLPNGDFDAGLSTWSAGSGTDIALSPDIYRTSPPGLHVRVEPGTTGDYFNAFLQRTAVPSPAGSGNSGAVYCAEAWVRRGAVERNLGIRMRSYDALAGFVDSVAEIPTASVRPADQGWYRVFTWLKVEPPYDQAISIRMYAGSVAGADFHVDDARLWVGTDGGCP